MLWSFCPHSNSLYTKECTLYRTQTPIHAYMYIYIYIAIHNPNSHTYTDILHTWIHLCTYTYMYIHPWWSLSPSGKHFGRSLIIPSLSIHGKVRYTQGWIPTASYNRRSCGYNRWDRAAMVPKCIRLHTHIYVCIHICVHKYMYIHTCVL